MFVSLWIIPYSTYMLLIAGNDFNWKYNKIKFFCFVAAVLSEPTDQPYATSTNAPYWEPCTNTLMCPLTEEHMKRYACIHLINSENVSREMYSSLSLLCVCVEWLCRQRLLNLYCFSLRFLSWCLRFIFLLNPLFCCLIHLFSLNCAPSTAFGSHMGIRQVETLSNVVQYSSGELPLQSQSLKASIISNERVRWREAGRGKDLSITA